MTDTPLRVLIVEDSAPDAELMVRELKRGGYAPEWARVESAAGFLAELRQPWDVILADYTVPGFSGLDALDLLVESGLDIPFIIVSGNIGDELAVAAIRRGAADYVLKDRLKRLGIAVGRALRDVAAKRERDAAERSLRLRSAALDAAAEAIVIFDRDGRIMYVNNAFSAWTGYTAEQAVGQFTRELTRPLAYDEALYAATWSDLLAGKVVAVETPLRRADGALIPVAATGTPIRDEHGVVTHVIAIYRDISRRKAAEAATRALQDRLTVAVRAGNVGLWDKDLRTGAVYYSPEWKRQIGYDDDELPNDSQEWRTRVHPDDLERVVATESAAIAGLTDTYETSYRFRHKDGSWRHILARGTVRRNASGAAEQITGAHVDLTDMMALQAQLLQAQKMEVLGRLTGGVAHDFNNLLTVIIGTAELALRTVPAGEALAADLAEIRDTGQRAANLTRQLLAFSRRQVMRPEVLSASAAVRRSAEMLRRLVPETVSVRLELADAGDTVHVDPVQLEQVIMNLVVNACDAMPAGGTLTIGVRVVELDHAFAREHPGVAPGPFVLLSIRDTGVGMDAATRARALEPFFTTKPAGRGTGLGLSTVYGIVTQSGGHLTLDSSPGAGTEVRVYLPQVASASQPSPTEQPVVMARGTESVLVVEDVPALGQLCQRILEEAGYRVTLAADAPDALARLDRHDLVLTDVVLPGMTGIDLAMRVRATRPEVKVLLMSGYNPAANANVTAPLEFGFIPKPFTAAELTRKVRDTLDS